MYLSICICLCSYVCIYVSLCVCARAPTLYTVGFNVHPMATAASHYSCDAVSATVKLSIVGPSASILRVDLGFKMVAATEVPNYIGSMSFEPTSNVDRSLCDAWLPGSRF